MSCGLHDVLAFEALGRPAVLVHSSVFGTTASEQSHRLGQPGARRVAVPHPIQDRTDAELRAMASAAAGEVLTALMR